MVLANLLKIGYKAKIKNIESKIPSITNLATITALNAKIIEIKDEIPSISDLATTAAFTAVEMKILNVSDVVKKTDYDEKISDIEKNILLLLIIINLGIIYLIQR